MLCFVASRREERKVARGWQIRSVVGWAWWERTYSRSSVGRAGGRAMGVRGIVFMVFGLFMIDWLAR